MGFLSLTKVIDNNAMIFNIFCIFLKKFFLILYQKFWYQELSNRVQGTLE
ncbi:putative membrane protein [Marinomonas primoryensis]|uniref:Putative membrane protein n=1 Tax=Marinomonas primoryensis TaxID=178399 RepID=A0A859CYE6_9GAMM|nr:putative membrane protein [Marinomonas primoryensis]